MRYPLPYLEKPGTRFMVRSITAIAKRFVLSVEGPVENLTSDPLIVVLNHNQRLEALMVPAIIFFLRNGKPVHFLADWNFLMVPVVNTIYRRSQTIIVMNKDAKPKFLNRLKPLFKEEKPAFERALDYLENGSSVGVFPEGTINRDPQKMMRGMPGAARLSIDSGAPVLPVGIRFPGQDPSQPIRDGAKMSLHVGEPLHPPSQVEPGKIPHRQLLAFHAEMMQALSSLCGKSWRPDANKRRKYV